MIPLKNDYPNGYRYMGYDSDITNKENVPTGLMT